MTSWRQWGILKLEQCVAKVWYVCPQNTLKSLSGSHLGICSNQNTSTTIIMEAHIYMYRRQLSSIYVFLENVGLNNIPQSQLKKKQLRRSCSTRISHSIQFWISNDLREYLCRQVLVQLRAVCRQDSHYFQYAQPAWHTPQIHVIDWVQEIFKPSQNTLSRTEESEDIQVIRMKAMTFHMNMKTQRKIQKACTSLSGKEWVEHSRVRQRQRETCSAGW